MVAELSLFASNRAACPAVTLFSANLLSFAGFRRQFDRVKNSVKPDRVVKAWRATRSLAYVLRHQTVNARNISRYWRVIKAKVVG
jgi:hypothetical protein